MKYEELFANLEISIQLDNLNLGYKTFYCWYYIKDNITNRERFYIDKRDSEQTPIASAYNCTELGILISEKIKNNWHTEKIFDRHELHKGDWKVVSHTQADYRVYGKTEVDARAKFLIYLSNIQ